MKIIKIGPVELTEGETEKAYSEGKYIVNYNSVYSIHYSRNAGFYGTKIYSRPGNAAPGLTRRGRFILADAEQVNRIICFNLLIA